MKKINLEIWDLGYGIEFHWKAINGPPFLLHRFDGPFEDWEHAAAYFELRWIRNDRENSDLVPRLYEGKKERKIWNRAKDGLGLSLSPNAIKERFFHEKSFTAP